ncbi:hypothetical protein CTAYLR_007611 [Chrysophaeum taylorii]|uniref:Cyclic nucleotide-binding domain-containing protein n=1 Tax=Chrysophaeum taylorii TaxID=2483200 RepID=A0AAD7U780_9STRA|nr:hypothetical protein CTAYLR_007611 [Chrysophaeum taylorii]
MDECSDDGSWSVESLGEFTALARVVVAGARLLCRARRRIGQRNAHLRERNTMLRGLESLYQLLEAEGEERNVNAITTKLLRLAPGLVKDLAKASQKRIAMHVQCKLYDDGDLVFREGDRPNGFFFVLHGSVGIYKRTEASKIYDAGGDNREGPRSYESEKARVNDLGPFLARLGEQAGFGSLAFSRNGKDLRRTASVVAEYVPDETDLRLLRSEAPRRSDVLLSSKNDDDDDDDDDDDYSSGAAKQRTRRRRRRRRRGEAVSDPRWSCAMLLVPNKIYVTDISTNVDATLQRKIGLLEHALVFETWAVEAIYPLAHEMTLAKFEAGEVVCAEGDETSYVRLVASGEVRVKVRVEVDVGDERDMDVALLPAGEMFGLVEAYRRLGHHRASMIATKPTEVALLPLESFRRAVSSDERAASVVRRIAANRERWEAMRKASIPRFKEAPPLTLTLDMTAEARYLIEPASVLEGAELRAYETDMAKCVDLARFARAYVREAADRWKSGRPLATRGCLERGARASALAIEIGTRLRAAYGRSARLNRVLEELISRRDRIRERLYTLGRLEARAEEDLAAAAGAAAPLDDEDDDEDGESKKKKKKKSYLLPPIKPKLEVAVDQAIAATKPAATSLFFDTISANIMARIARVRTGHRRRRVETSRQIKLAAAEKKRLTLEQRFHLASIVTATDTRFVADNAEPQFASLRTKARNVDLLLREVSPAEWLGQSRGLATRVARRRRAAAVPPREEEEEEERANIFKKKRPWSVSAALGAASIDVEAVPAVIVVTTCDELRRFLRASFEHYGCVVDDEKRGMKALERLRQCQVAGTPYALGVFAAKLPGNLSGLTAALRHRDWESTTTDQVSTVQRLAVLVDPETPDDTKKRNEIRAEARAVTLLPQPCTVRDLIRLVCSGGGGGAKNNEEDAETRLLAVARTHQAYRKATRHAKRVKKTSSRQRSGGGLLLTPR